MWRVQWRGDLNSLASRAAQSSEIVQCAMYLPKYKVLKYCFKYALGQVHSCVVQSNKEFEAEDEEQSRVGTWYQASQVRIRGQTTKF